jgi:predicted DNA-binding transcriptional regulator AlpA
MRSSVRDDPRDVLERYLGWRDVQPLFGGISRTTAWRGVRDGWLPAPVQVSPGRKAWKASDIAAWQGQLEALGRAEAPPLGPPSRLSSWAPTLATLPKPRPAKRRYPGFRPFPPPRYAQDDDALP